MISKVILTAANQNTRGALVKSSKSNLPVSSSAISSSKRQAREFLSKFMEPDGPFLMPRPVPTSAGVIYQKPQFPLTQDLEIQQYGAMIIRPTVEDTMSYYSATGGSATVHPQTWDSGLMDPKIGVGSYASFAPPFLSDAGELAHDRASDPNFKSFVDGTWVNGQITYYDLPTVLASGSAPFAVRLTTNGVGTLRFYLLACDDTGSTVLTTPIQVETSSGPADYYTWTFNGSNHSINEPIVLAETYSGKFTFAIHSQSVSSNFTSSELVIDVVIDHDWIGGAGWYHKSFWDLLGNNAGTETIRRQYYAAQRTCVTGFSALLRNTTAALYKSGSLVAAQLTGGSESLVPNDAQGFYNFVASINDPKTYSGQLNKGAHWFFAAEKIQDLFYTTPLYANQRPYWVVAWSGVSVNDGANRLGLTVDFKFNVELMTIDISVMKFTPSMDPSGLMELYITLVSAHNPIGENPGHMKKIEKILSSVVNHPMFGEVVSKLAKAGVSLIPLLL